MATNDHLDILLDAFGELETQLLEYERSATVRQDTTDALLRLTLPIHGLKIKLRQAEQPAAAMLLQGLETLVTCYRKRSEHLSREAVDTLFGSFDAITESLHEPRLTRQRIDAVADRVIALIDDQQLTRPRDKLRPFPFQLTPDEQATLNQSRQDGKRPFVIEKVLSSNLDENTYNHLPLYDRIRSLGSLIAVRPTFADIDRSNAQVLLQIVGTTLENEEQVARTLAYAYDYCDWPSSATKRAAQTTDSTIEPIESSPVDEERHILIVEDEFISRSLLLALLGNYGCCDVAIDGREAVTAVAQAIGEKRPYALVCLDIMMPDMDGHRALEELRKVENGAGLPLERRAKVVMTTALSDYANFHRAYQASCDSYIVKPISKQVLVRQLRRIGLEPLS